MDKAKNNEIKSGKMQKIRDNRKNILIFLCVFIVNLIMCSAFLHPHYPHETYKIIHIGYIEYSKLYYIKEARPFSALLTIIADAIHLPIEIYSVISFILAVIILSISILILYNIFKNKIKNNSRGKSILLLAISYLIIMNYFAIEYIFFMECCIMALAILFTMIIVKINIKDEKNKYVKTFLLGLIVVFCYQGALALFPIIVLTYKLLFEKNTIKQNIKEIIKISILYIFLMVIPILYTKLLFNGSRLQVGAAEVNISDILFWIKQLAVKSLEVIPPFVHIGIVTITAISIAVIYKEEPKEKAIYIVKYIFIILYAIVMSLAPIVTGSGLELTPRTCIAYSCTIGLSLLVLFIIINNNDNKYQKIYIVIFTIIIFILNFILYVIITNQHLQVNKIDKENCLKIGEIIEEYEEKNDIKVTKIATLRRENSSQYYPGFIHAGTLTRKALNTWPLRETIIFYTGRELQFELFPMEKYVQYFNGLESQVFSIKQVAIEGDTLYFYGG